MRISSALPLVALAACTGRSDRTADTRVIAQVEAAATAQAEDDGRILCGRGDAPLARTCTVEQTREPRGLVLTLRHPDGGFHRLLVTRDGRGVVAADGAEAAIVTMAGGDDIDVTLGSVHYRLPVTVKHAT